MIFSVFLLHVGIVKPFNSDREGELVDILSFQLRRNVFFGKIPLACIHFFFSLESKTLVELTDQRFLLRDLLLNKSLILNGVLVEVVES